MDLTPHSLRKLIEWKHQTGRLRDIIVLSSLAEETNWMETALVVAGGGASCLVSSLAEETNWMETHSSIWAVRKDLTAPHSLRKLIEWKRFDSNFLLLVPPKGSSLAEETNWMETYALPLVRNCSITVSSLAEETNWMETSFSVYR